MAGVTDRVENHFRLFNDAVRSRDWTAFLATFSPDAVMRFNGVPAGPYLGSKQIAQAYAENPPSDTMTSGWNTLRIGGAIDDDELLEAVDASYAAVVSKLPRKDRPAPA